MAQQLDPKFDPYWEWLKIPPDQQPPNHYRLLGLKPFEADQTAIENAVNRLVERLQRLSQGPRVELAQRILNQVAQARLCFSDPTKKQTYDHQLRTRLNNRPAGTETASSANEYPAKPVASKTRNTTNLNSAGGGTKLSAEELSKQTAEVFEGVNEIERKIQRMKMASIGMFIFGSILGVLFVWLAFGARPEPVTTKQLALRPSVPKLSDATRQQAAHRSTEGALGDKNSPAALNPSIQGQSSTSTDDFAKAAKLAASNLEMSQPEVPTASTSTPSTSAPAPTAPAANADLGPAQSPPPATGSNPNQPSATTTTGEPAPSISEPEVKSGLKEIPDQPGTFAPSKSTDFAAFAKTVVGLQGKVIKARTSKSGKTNYLMFSDRYNELIEIRARTSQIALAEFEKLVGKTVRVRGELKEEFGSKILGLEIEALSQIEVLQ